MNIKQTLEEIGYKLRDENGHWRSSSLYRGGDNPTSLRINKETGSFVDFVTHETGSFTDLLKKSLGEKAEEKIKNLDFSNSEIPDKFKADKLHMSKKFSLDDLGTVIRNYNFYNKKGISEETQKLFDVSVCMSGSMCRRVVFPIYEPSGKALGFAGRSIFGSEIKWKKKGESRLWVYPLHISEPYIKEQKCAILVESIGDCLALWEAGIKNVLVLFGIKLFPKMIEELMRLNLDKIVVATNNDVNSQIGNKAAIQIKNKLSHYFDEDKIIIKLPQLKDFGDQTSEMNLNWLAELNSV